MRPHINPPADALDDINLALLKIAFPEFWFGQYIRGRRLRWVAVRMNGGDRGLHTMVTDDLDELCATLLLLDDTRRLGLYPYLAGSIIPDVTANPQSAAH